MGTTLPPLEPPDCQGPSSLAGASITVDTGTKKSKEHNTRSLARCPVICLGRNSDAVTQLGSVSVPLPGRLANLTTGILTNTRPSPCPQSHFRRPFAPFAPLWASNNNRNRSCLQRHRTVGHKCVALNLMNFFALCLMPGWCMVSVARFQEGISKEPREEPREEQEQSEEECRAAAHLPHEFIRVVCIKTNWSTRRASEIDSKNGYMLSGLGSRFWIWTGAGPGPRTGPGPGHCSSARPGTSTRQITLPCCCDAKLKIQVEVARVVNLATC